MDNNNSKDEYREIIKNLGSEILDMKRLRGSLDALTPGILWYILKLLNERLGE